MKALGNADRLEQTSSMLCAQFGHNLGVNIWHIMDVNPYKSGLVGSRTSIIVPKASSCLNNNNNIRICTRSYRIGY